MRFATEIYNDKITESKAFYCNIFNFKVKYELEGYVIIQHKENSAYELLFCIPNSPFVDEIFRPKFYGKGLIFQMEVSNVEIEYERIKNLHIPIVLKLKEEPFNGKHFTITDPNGIYIDIVQKR